jgi:uncharacterized protein YndB with AHSA1/START domain
MSANLIAKSTVVINAPASEVWDALTNPAKIKEYLFGTEAVSDWQVGSKLEFKGKWEGQDYVDKGIILKSQPEKLFQYTYYSAFSGLVDAPENYTNISYELDEDAGQTTLTVKTENISDENTRQRSEDNWKGILQHLKDIVEKEHQTA